MAVLPSVPVDPPQTRLAGPRLSHDIKFCNRFKGDINVAKQAARCRMQKLCNYLPLNIDNVAIQVTRE